MKRGDGGRIDGSQVEAWVDIARRGADAGDAESRRARMLCASHREARLESAVMADFDPTRDARAGDGAVIDDAVGRAMFAIARARAAPRPDRDSHVAFHPAAPSGATPVGADGDARVASAVRTPGPQAAVRMSTPPRRRAIVAASGAMLCGIAIGVVVTTSWLGSSEPTAIATDTLGVPAAIAPAAIAPTAIAPAAIAPAAIAPASIATSVAPTLVEPIAAEPIAIAPVVAPHAAALAALDRARPRHRAGHLLISARTALEQDDAPRAERTLRIVARRWPRRAEGSLARTALIALLESDGRAREAAQLRARARRARR